MIYFTVILLLLGLPIFPLVTFVAYFLFDFMTLKIQFNIEIRHYVQCIPSAILALWI